MTTTTTQTLRVKTAKEYTTDILRTLRNGLIQRGVATPNVGYGSDYYVTASALAGELEGISAACVALGEQLMPDTASGAYLDQWASIMGISRRGPGPSIGKVILDGPVNTSTTVPTGSELLDPIGNRFTVNVGGTYITGNSIDVTSVDSGKGANLDAGTILRWVSTPAYMYATAALDADGATGGVDQEDDETLRGRILEKMRVPPGGGNWSQIAAVAESASASIQKAFVYPAANGPSTVHVAVAGYGAAAALYHLRSLNTTITTEASDAVLAEIAEYAEATTTTVTDQIANLSFILTLPDATTATSGQASGWIDATPWPSVTGATQQYCRATIVTNAYAMRVESATVPATGETVAWVDTDNHNLHTAKVVSSTTVLAPSLPTMGTFDIVIDAPFTGIVSGHWIFPAAVNSQTYLDAIITTFGLLGPGEKTSVAGVLPRAYRRPRYYEAFDYHLGGQFLRALTDSGSEVLDAAWGHQNGGTTTPTLPTVISDPPSIFVPQNLGFYA